MGKTYEKVDIGATVQDVMQRWHKELADAGVTIDTLMVSTDSETAPPLKLRGCPCAAICRVQPLKARALGCADAEIQIDADRWEVGTEEQRRALLDHEITHLELSRDGNENVKLDDLGRPKLHTRLHDYELGWFTVCAARHGENSMERRQAQALMDSAGETYWPAKQHVKAATAAQPVG